MENRIFNERIDTLTILTEVDDDNSNKINMRYAAETYADSIQLFIDLWII